MKPILIFLLLIGILVIGCSLGSACGCTSIEGLANKNNTTEALNFDAESAAEISDNTTHNKTKNIGGDPATWTPQNNQGTNIGGDPATWSPSSDIIGGDPNTWTPQTEIDNNSYKKNRHGRNYKRENHKYSKELRRSEIPEGDEDLYILKSEIVPPVCPACPPLTTCPRETPCPPCPPCGRCPEPSFTCEKVPNYTSPGSSQYVPRPVLADFSQFGM
tara:strand:- start:2894 stop:3544 length:651 start_codon:yes stop_codon:yes gene_type:complete